MEISSTAWCNQDGPLKLSDDEVEVSYVLKAGSVILYVKYVRTVRYTGYIKVSRVYEIFACFFGRLWNKIYDLKVAIWYICVSPQPKWCALSKPITVWLWLWLQQKIVRAFRFFSIFAFFFLKKSAYVGMWRQLYTVVSKQSDVRLLLTK